jgi:hypothetical protein
VSYGPQPADVLQQLSSISLVRSLCYAAAHGAARIVTGYDTHPESDPRTRCHCNGHIETHPPWQECTGELVPLVEPQDTPLVQKAVSGQVI